MQIQYTIYNTFIQHTHTHTNTYIQTNILFPLPTLTPNMSSRITARTQKTVKVAPAPVVETKQVAVTPALNVSGKLIKVNVRSYPNKDASKPNYEFYSGLLVVDSPDSIQEYEEVVCKEQPNLTAYFCKEDTFMGQTKTNHFVTFELNGKSVYDKEELAWIHRLAEQKKEITCDLIGAQESFTAKDGTKKTKFMLSLLPYSIKEVDAETPAKKQKTSN